jgi:hypothetical protein
MHNSNSNCNSNDSSNVEVVRARRAKSLRTGLLGVMLCGSLALLIWNKLRLVTGTPRSAYAVPDEQSPQGKNAPEAQPTADSAAAP